MTDAASKWTTAYRQAWESNDPGDIGALFTADALYYGEPFTEPARGRDAIIERWLEHQDAPGTTKFTWNVLSSSNDLAFVQCETDYGSVKYSNLWIIRFAASAASAIPQATEFTDWWMDQSKPSG